MDFYLDVVGRAGRKLGARLYYVVRIRQTDTGYSADAPDLPGCVAAGATIEETKGLMHEAIEAHFAEVERYRRETRL